MCIRDRDYTNYTIENVDRCCVQSSPVTVDSSSEASAANTRKGNRAYYFWQYPNFMLNWYEGYLDTNLDVYKRQGKGTTSAGSQGTMQRPCALRFRSRITVGRSMLAMYEVVERCV